MKTAIELVKRYRPCSDAVEWLGNRTPAKAWRECKRADWMLWLAARAGVDRRKVVKAACACARTALKYVKNGEDRPRRAIETVERWCEGKATIKEVRAASAAAAAYAASAAAAYAAYAADDAAYVAYASDAADAAAYVAYAASAAAYVAARETSYARMANLVRKHITLRDILRAMGEGRGEVKCLRCEGKKKTLVVRAYCSDWCYFGISKRRTNCPSKSLCWCPRCHGTGKEPPRKGKEKGK